MSQAENGSVAGALWRFAVAALLTAAVVYACWWLWEEIPQYVRRTPLQDYRYLVNLLAIFLFLSLLNPILWKIWILLTGKQDEH